MDDQQFEKLLNHFNLSWKGYLKSYTASTGKELKISPIFWLCAAFLATSVDSKGFYSLLV